MKKQERRHFTPEQKSQIPREHHLDKVPVAELCERHQLQPSVFSGEVEIDLNSVRRSGTKLTERRARPMPRAVARRRHNTRLRGEITVEVTRREKFTRDSLGTIAYVGTRA